MHRDLQQCAAILLIGSAGFLSACVSTPNTPPPTMVAPQQSIRTLSFDEAISYERALQAMHLEAPPPPQPLYTQPVNKTEPCKLPTSLDQIKRPDFRAYWDGDCKDGYAYGMGRDIAISDTHHVEEITIHNGTGDAFGQPSITVDLVHNTARYGVVESDLSSAGVFEQLQSNAGNFNVTFQVGEGSAAKRAYAISSPFSPVRNRVMEERGVRWLSQETAAGYPFDDASQLEAGFMVQDPATNQPVLTLARFAGGAVVHRVLRNGTEEVVRLPAEYLSHLTDRFAEVDRAIDKAHAAYGRAQHLEREYLRMACSGQHAIEGLDPSTATRICNWRDSFKEAYAEAQARYEQHLAEQRAKQQAQAQRNHEVQMERARQIQNEMAAQQAQAQFEYDQSVRNLAETNRQLQQTTNRIIESNAERTRNFQIPTFNWQQPKQPYQAPLPSWAERSYVPVHTPGSLTDKRWENGALWCIYSNGRVLQAQGPVCPMQLLPGQ